MVSGEHDLSMVIAIVRSETRPIIPLGEFEEEGEEDHRVIVRVDRGPDNARNGILELIETPVAAEVRDRASEETSERILKWISADECGAILSESPAAQAFLALVGAPLEPRLEGLLGALMTSVLRKGIEIGQGRLIDPPE